jgi:hypothetical protein
MIPFTLLILAGVFLALSLMYDDPDNQTPHISLKLCFLVSLLAYAYIRLREIIRK